MMPQETLIPRKRRGPPPTGQGVPIMLRLQPEQLAALDRWIAAQPEPKLSRPEAIRRLLTAALGQDDVLLTAYREIVELNLADAEAANEEDWIEPLRAELQNPPDFQDLWG